MRCTAPTRRLTLICLRTLAFLLSTVAAAVAADPAKPAATSGSKTLARVVPESAAQANVRHAQRSKLDIPKGDVTPAPADAGAVTIDALGTMLDNMGFDPKAGTYTSGEKYYIITIVRDTWTVGITFEVSSDKSEIWLSAYFGDVADPDKVKPAPLFNLLEANNAIWPSYFYYVTDSKSLYMYRPLPNSNIKADLILRHDRSVPGQRAEHQPLMGHVHLDECTDRHRARRHHRLLRFR